MSSYILTDTTLTLVVDNKVHTAHTSNTNWDKIIVALKDGDIDEVISLIDIAEQINQYGEGSVIVRGGVVYYGDEELDNSLSQRILKMMKEGFNVTPLVKFLDNLMDNPSARSVQDVYRFLEHNSLPLTEDGHFLAYKKVDASYKDSYTRTIDNSVGQVVTMARNKVQDNPDVTCSHGLHFASMDYINAFYGSHIMILKINPADVVSIPTDYNNAKGRCCRYEVIGEHMDGTKDTLSERAVHSTPANDNYHNKRDASGRFMKR